MYKQITYPQRVLIEQFKRQGMSIIQIAVELGYHRSTIYRELDRNSSPGSYKLYGSARAQDRSEQRAQGKGRKNKITSYLKSKVDQLLKIKWSPEQIEGRANIDKYERVSKECIYQYVYEDKRKGGDLWSNLRHSHRSRRRRKNTYKQRGIIKNRVCIEDRPKIVESQKRYGDWEGDTIVGKNHKSQIASMVERKSLFVKIIKLESKEAKFTAKTISCKLKKYKNLCHTITLDNGKENADHQTLAKALNTKIYFAHPYSAYERGCNENINGLIRQYLPKKSDFSMLKQTDLDRIESQINNRPRKKLGYKTPNEVFLNLVALKC